MKVYAGSFVRWFSFGIFVVSMMCLAGGAFADPPATINIRGQLLDAQGHALPGLRDFSVQFFDAGTGGAALGSVILGQTDVSIEGLFNIPVTLPPQVLLSPQAWYAVAVASGPEPAPLNGADLFPNRIKVESVPFALESAEAAHVDVSAIGSGTILDAEFGYLSGVTSGIQGQLDAKANAADVYTKTQEDAAHALKANATDVYTKTQEDAAHALKANAADVYTKDDVDDSQAAQDLEIAAKANAADVYTKGDVDTLQGVQDTEIAGKVAKAGDTMTGALNVNNSYVGIGQAAAPAAPANKLYNLAGALYWNGQQVVDGGSSGFPWTVVTADTQMAANNGYIANSASLITLTLPLSANINVGDIIRVAGMGAGGWKIAQNTSQTILCSQMQIPNYSGSSWYTRAVANDWSAMASSADGRVLVAGEYGGSGGVLYTSWDYGVTWVDRALNQYWYGLASSADGRILVGVTGGYIYTSWDSGATWTQRGTSQSWGACAASAEGRRMVATWNTDLYVSTDWGSTWVSKDTAWNGWSKVAMSADGMNIAVCTNAAGTYYIRLSVDGGETFSNRNGLTGTYYGDVAMSADGTKIAACAYGGQIWTSADTGVTWTAHESVRNWRAIAMSADGTRLMAHDLNGYVYISTDSGLTWNPGAVAYNINNHGLVMSADGTKAAFGQWGGNIFTLNTSGTVTATVAGTAGYISGTADTAVELQYQGSNIFRVLSYESGKPDSSTVWKLGGNAGTTPGAHYLGTSDNVALEMRVNGARAFRLEPNLSSPNVIGGYSGNFVTGGVNGATIAGGGTPGYENSVSAYYATISGGIRNTVGGYYSTVAGGMQNTASGNYSTVAGGFQNTVTGDWSFAAGSHAHANHAGCFVWSTHVDTYTDVINQFVARATGGFKFYTGMGTSGAQLAAGSGSWTSLSDRNMKENFEPVDCLMVLENVAELPISTWNYKTQDPAFRHMGPMAQDLYAAFGLGESDTGIDTIDADGVALAAIQGVNQKLEAKVAEQNEKIQSLESRIAKLEALVEQLAAK